MAKKAENLIGKWAFVIGIIIAILAGLFGDMTSNMIVGTLVVVGLIVGLLNVTAKEVTHFLLSGVALAIISEFGGDVLAVVGLGGVMTAIMAIVVPAVIIVAIREVFGLAKK